MPNGKLSDFIAHYRYQTLSGSGEPIGEKRVMNWREVRIAVSIECPAYSLRDLNHMRDLLHAAAGNPVELVYWNRTRTGIDWSARLELIREDTQLTSI